MNLATEQGIRVNLPGAQPLRILHVIATVEATGGGPIEGILQQNFALPDGYGVREIATLDPPDAPFLAEVPMKVHALGTGSFRTIKRSHWEKFSYSRRLVPWLKMHASDYDCIVINGLWNYASVGAAIAISRQNTPYFVFSHGMMDPWFRKTKPFIHVVKQISWFFFEGRLLAGARAVFFTTEDERLLARGQFLGYRYREEVVSYGTMANRGDPVAQIAAFRLLIPRIVDRSYFLFLSRIHPKKGCDLLIRAFAEYVRSGGQLDLVIAGPDQVGWAESLKDIAMKCGVDNRIHWPGMLRGDEKWGAFRAADAFVLPSHQENFGIVVAEALSCGKPVLITNKVNIWREILQYNAGFVGDDDQTGVCNLFRQYDGSSDDVLEGMALSAVRCFDENFNLLRNSVGVIEKMRSLL